MLALEWFYSQPKSNFQVSANTQHFNFQLYGLSVISPWHHGEKDSVGPDACLEVAHQASGTQRSRQDLFGRQRKTGTYWAPWAAMKMNTGLCQI